MLQMSDDDLKNAIKFEADKYIPFEVDEVVLDCQRLEEENKVSAESGEPEMKVQTQTDELRRLRREQRRRRPLETRASSCAR